jgi:hypothetical protein
LRNPLREIRTVGSVREELSRRCHGGPKRARSWKRRTQPRNTYSLSGLLYSERRDITSTRLAVINPPLVRYIVAMHAVCRLKAKAKSVGSGRWTLNPTAHKAFAPSGNSIGLLFFALSIVLVITAVGWFKHRIWEWRLTVAIISTQVIGDFVNFMRGDFLRGSIGLLIAGALLLFLLRSTSAQCSSRTNAHEVFHNTMADTSTPPSTAQQIALLCSPANQYPLAALKQRIALVHPLAHAPGLASI